MIRRSVPLGSEPTHWQLIDQREHARISRALAEEWHAENGLLASRWRDDVLYAIAAHDDGWEHWDEAPGLDPKTGIPRSFTEMPHEAALAIWADSIRQCAEQRGWPAYAIAGHFLWLLADSHGADQADSQAWRGEMETLQSRLLDRAGAPNRREADGATALVRLFDWLSLWLCCYCPVSPSDESTMKSTSIDSGELSHGDCQFCHAVDSNAANVVIVDPWPFATEMLDLTANCRRVVAMHYQSTDDLLAACESDSITWRIRPAAPL